MIFFIIILSTLVQHHLLGTAYLQHRTATLYIPILQLLVLMGWLQFVQKYTHYLRKLAFILPLLYLYQILGNRGFYSVREWWYDENTKDMVIFVNAHTKAQSKVKLGCNWGFVPTARFYRATLPLPNIDSIMYNKEIVAEPIFDYYYTYFSELKELSNVYKVVARFGYDRILLQKDSLLFAKRKAEILQEWNPTSEEYSKFKKQADEKQEALDVVIEKAVLLRMGQEKLQVDQQKVYEQFQSR